MSSEFKDREVQTLYQGSVPFVSATLHPFYPYNTAITDGPTRDDTVSPIVSSILSHVISPEHPSYQARTDASTQIPTLPDFAGVQKGHHKKAPHKPDSEAELDRHVVQRGQSPDTNQSLNSRVIWGTAYENHYEDDQPLTSLFPAPLSSSAYVTDSEVELIKTKTSRRTKSVGPGEVPTVTQQLRNQRVKGHVRAASGGSVQDAAAVREPTAQRRNNTHIRQSSAPDSVQRSPSKAYPHVSINTEKGDSIWSVNSESGSASPPRSSFLSGLNFDRDDRDSNSPIGERKKYPSNYDDDEDPYHPHQSHAPSRSHPPSRSQPPSSNSYPYSHSHSPNPYSQSHLHPSAYPNYPQSYSQHHYDEEDGKNYSYRSNNDKYDNKYEDTNKSSNGGNHASNTANSNNTAGRSQQTHSSGRDHDSYQAYDQYDDASPRGTSRHRDYQSNGRGKNSADYSGNSREFNPYSDDYSEFPQQQQQPRYSGRLSPSYDANESSSYSMPYSHSHSHSNELKHSHPQANSSPVNTPSTSQSTQQQTQQPPTQQQQQQSTAPPMHPVMAPIHQQQLQLSAIAKQQYKDFFKDFKEKEKDGGFELALQFAQEKLPTLPVSVHWKVYLEVADLAKRENHFDQAREYYGYVNRNQPFAGKGWLEFAKMEEECGNLKDCTKILVQGLEYCPQNENLLVKGIKHYEKLNNLPMARTLLYKVQKVPVEQSWRTIMEGGLLEARQGHIHLARLVFRYLIYHVPHYGPIYVEAVKLEIKEEEYESAMSLVEKGLLRNPSYGPLWFLALKLDEKLGGDCIRRVDEALPRLSKELVWKMWVELAQIHQRKGEMRACRAAYVKAVFNCPKNLRWKVWHAGARTELQTGQHEAARLLLARALADVPLKMRATVLVEQARFEEHRNNLPRARAILARAKKETVHEWKVFLESVLLEIRANNLEGALKEVQMALDEHNSTGRLWAILIQLTHLTDLQTSAKSGNVTAQTKVLRQALDTVPKSGEVWCEGARIAIHVNMLDLARKYLDFAIQFTPQYGDSFIEYMRLELLLLVQTIEEGEEVNVEALIGDKKFVTAFENLERLCVNAEPTYGVCWSYCRDDPSDSSKKCLRNAKAKLIEMAKEHLSLQARKKQAAKAQIPLEERSMLIYSKLDIAAYFLGRGRSIHEEPEDFRFKAIFN